MCRVAWREGRAPVDWQTGIVVLFFKKGDRRECFNYRGITLLSLPGKVYTRVLEWKCQTIVEAKIQDTQRGFRPGRGTTDQLFILRQVFEKAWKFVKPVYIAFIGLEKAYDRVPRHLLWSVLKEYGINGHLLAVIRSLYNDCKSRGRINGSKSNSFRVRVGLRQGCVFSPLLFIISMNRIAREKHHTRLCDDGECESRVSALCGRHRSIGILKCWTPTCSGSIRGGMYNGWYTDQYKENRSYGPLETKGIVCYECQWNPIRSSGEI